MVESGSDDARIGTFDGWPVYHHGDHEADWAAAICPGNGLVLAQPPDPLSANVQHIDPVMAASLAAQGQDVDGDPSESASERLQLNVRLTVSLAIGLRVRSGGVRRVKLTRP